MPAPQIIVDGRADDWGMQRSSTTAHMDDERGLLQVDVARRDTWLLLRIELPDERVLQRNSNVSLELMSGRTEDLVLEWDFGLRRGTRVSNGATLPVGIAEVPVIVAPAFGARTFEVALDLELLDLEEPRSEPLRITVQDANSQDRAPTVVTADVPPPPRRTAPLDPLTIGRGSAEAVRVVVWNVQRDGISSRPKPFGRVLRALDPDILLLGEVFSTEPEWVADALAEWTPPTQGGAPWTVVRHSDGSMIALRGRVRETWPIPEGTGDGFVLEVRSDDGRTRTIALVHAWAACCDADSLRQLQIDRIAAFTHGLPDRFAASGWPATLPIVVAGDFNLVGDGRSYRTLTEGSIVNTASLPAPRAEPFPLVDVHPRHVAAPFTWAWRDDATGFGPGRLEMLFHSEHGISVTNAFILHEGLDAALLTRLGLEADDMVSASDHRPLVADLVATGRHDPHEP